MGIFTEHPKRWLAMQQASTVVSYVFALIFVGLAIHFGKMYMVNVALENAKEEQKTFKPNWTIHTPPDFLKDSSKINPGPPKFNPPETAPKTPAIPSAGGKR
jgi:hypothetical protein